MRKTKSKIHREKEDEKRAIGKASLGKKFTFISSAWTLSRLTFFDEDSYFSAFCEMCLKFTLRPLGQNMQMKIPNEIPQKTSTLC